MPNNRRQGERRRANESTADDRRATERRQAQRRQEPRVDVDLWAVETQAGAAYYRRVANLSPSGIYFDVGIPNPIGANVKVRFTLPDDETPIEVTGVVARAEWDGERLAGAVRFTAMRDQDRKRVEHFVNDLLTADEPAH